MSKSERIFRALFLARERGCSVHELIDAAYAGDPGGGALYAITSVGLLVRNLNRRHLAPLGFRIVNRGGSNNARRYLVKACARG